MQASTLVIFGATGDLTHRKLIPALYHLFAENRLPADFNIVGFARRDESRKAHVEGLKNSLMRFQPKVDQKVWQEFAKQLHYVQGDFDSVPDYVSLAEFLKQFDPPGSCSNKIFYLATAPEYFTTIIENLESAQVYQLLGDCWKRVILEKPFGADLQSARELNQLVDSKFDEKEIYRIDHYLAKETVQNIIAFRFANGLFAPIWNRDFIDHIQITVAENFGVESRGGYYDQAGNLRDFIQNHLLQLLALTTMRAPENLEADSIREARLQALQSIRKMSEGEINDVVVFGQYDSYRSEDKVAENSKTDTFTALKLESNLPQWRGVPIYIRSGKQLPVQAAYINVCFKEANNALVDPRVRVPNVLTFHIQPSQEITISIMVKEPGKELKMKNVELHFNYDEAFKTETASAYEKLLLDIIEGSQTFFPRADEVEASWEVVDPIIKNRERLQLHNYTKGSWGPKEADELIEKDGRKWVNQK